MRKEFSSPEFNPISFPEGKLKPNLFAHTPTPDQIKTKTKEIVSQAFFWKPDIEKTDQNWDKNILDVCQKITEIAGHHIDAESDYDKTLHTYNEAKADEKKARKNPLINETDINTKLSQLNEDVTKHRKEVIETNNQLSEYGLDKPHRKILSGRIEKPSAPKAIPPFSGEVTEDLTIHELFEDIKTGLGTRIRNTLSRADLKNVAKIKQLLTQQSEEEFTMRIRNFGPKLYEGLRQRLNIS